MARHRLMPVAVAALTVLLLAATAFLLHAHLFRPTTISAVFASATSIYPGDEVRIAGVKVGTITSVHPDGAQATMTLSVDHGVSVPADAKAVVIAQNLVSSRFVQLAPAYRDGPRLTDGAVIPLERTAVPVEWDEVKEQLTRLATDLGPRSDVSASSVGRFIDSAANAMDGNGEKLRQTLTQLAGVGRILANGSGNLVDMVKNLQTFVAVLRQSNEQIVQFQDRLATLSSVVNGARSDLDSALTNLSQAVGEVQRFVHDTRDKTSEQVARLVDVTQNLVDHRMDLEQVLHVAPTAIANSYNMFDPRTGGASGVFVLNNMNNPAQFICGMTAALENVTATETGKLCTQYLGPGLNKLNFNYLPFPFNPLLTSTPSADQLIYSEPQLAPGGPDPGSAPAPPVVSAYTGGPGDQPPPPPPAPAEPSSAPTTLPDMLLPAEAPPS